MIDTFSTELTKFVQLEQVGQFRSNIGRLNPLLEWGGENPPTYFLLAALLICDRILSAAN